MNRAVGMSSFDMARVGCDTAKKFASDEDFARWF